MSQFRFPATRPELPAPEAWTPHLKDAYAANRFTNFGVLAGRLEDRLAADWGFSDTACIAASSGTAALAAPLIAAGISGPVLLPAFTFPATLSAVRMAGCSPWLLDVSAGDWRVSADTLARGFHASGAKAAILLCPFGLRTDFTPHIAAAKEAGAVLVIDNAAGLGVARRPVEAEPHVFEVYSLHATKPFGIGEGGAMFAHTSRAAALRRALNFGLPADGGRPDWGINGKLSEFQAAVGLAVAETFQHRLALRRAFAARLMDRLARHAAVAVRHDPADSAWQMFPVLTPSEAAADALVAAARGAGMEARRYYRPSLSGTEGVAGGACLVSEDLAARMCCLPVYSLLSADEERDMLEAADLAVQAAVV